MDAETTKTKLKTLLGAVDPLVGAQLADLEKALVSDPDHLPPIDGVLLWLNPASLAERAEHTFGRWARIWEGIRNVLTLAPLIVTWASLSAATYNFGYIASRGLVTSERSFLELWETGFQVGGENAPVSVPTFSEVARLDVVLLLLLLISSIIFQQVSQRAADRARSLRQLLEQYLPDLLTQLDFRRRDHEREIMRDTLTLGAGTITHALQGLVDDVREQRERLKDLAAQRDAELTALATVSLNLGTSSASMVEHTGRMRGLAEQIERATTSLWGAAAEMVGLRKDMHAVLDDFVRKSTDLAESVSHILAGYADLRTSLRTLSDQMKEDAARLERRFVAQDERSDQRQRQLDELAKSIASQAVALQKGLDTLITRVPSAGAIAGQVAGAWASAQKEYLTRLNEQLSETIESLSGRLRADIADPLLKSPLIATGAMRIEELNGAVARLDAAMDKVHRDATLLGAALQGLTGAMDGTVDVGKPYLEWPDTTPPRRS